ncbi:MAG: hypothetical protein HGN29_07870 [Asgard group archaeon]|nr:hypothetical protein [Asgard group archaeon]
MDRKILKEKQRELKENVRGKPYFNTIKPKIRFTIEVFKLIFKDIKSTRLFHSKKSKTQDEKLIEDS